VEDDADDASLIRMAFRRAGFDEHFEMVTGVEEALGYLSGEGKYADRASFPFPNLVMLDHKMPGDGWPVIEWVRQRPELALLPVVVFSGSDDPSHQKKASDLGANAYHVKPQNFEEFVDVVRRIREFWLLRQ
jgi:CheY-like chemotaxis protein